VLLSRFALALCAACVALATHTANAQSAAPSPAPNKPSAEQLRARAEAGVLADPAAQVRALASASLADRVQAQLRLARSPEQALPLLDEALAKGKVDAAHVKPLLALALLFHDIEAQLVARPRLHALVKARIEHGRALARVFAKREDVETYYFDGWHFRPKPGDPTQAAIDLLFALDGLAVPACRELCKGESAAGRVYAALFLTRLGAPAAIPELELLLEDSRMVRQRGECYDGQAPVSQQAREALKTNGQFIRYATNEREAHFVTLEIEHYAQALLRAESLLGTNLINDLRDANGRSAASWEAWWASADESWSMWWTLKEQHPTQSPHREAWREYLRTRAPR